MYRAASSNLGGKKKRPNLHFSADTNQSPIMLVDSKSVNSKRGTKQETPTSSGR